MKDHRRMDATPALARKPLVVIVGQHPWLLRSLESILASNDFAVLTVQGENGGYEFPEFEADLAIVEADGRRSWSEHLGAIREGGQLRATTPIIATTVEPLTRQARLDAMRAGAWDVLGHPLDAELLVMKATVYARSKFEADEARERGLVDPETDLYNVRGVMRRIYEEASEAARQKLPLACLVAAVAGGNGDVPETSERARATAQALRRTARSSDIFGRLAASEFVVIAPGTDARGALCLAQRLTSEPAEGASMPRLQAGFAAVNETQLASIEPVDLFVRAMVALRAAQATGSSERVRSFD